jgi:isoquinoline 1-oxidoreductase beta subunit
MRIAEEMDADYDRVDVELADRRADRPQTITGGSSTIRTMWEPARTVRANARLRLVTARGGALGRAADRLTVKKSTVITRRRDAARTSASCRPRPPALALPVVPLPLQIRRDYTIIGTPARTQERARDRHGRAEVHARLGVAEGAVPRTRACGDPAPARHQGPRRRDQQSRRGAGDAGRSLAWCRSTCPTAVPSTRR